MKKFLLLLTLNSALLIQDTLCFSQNAQMDSLLSILETTNQDTTKVNTFNNLFLEYEFSDDAKAKEYLNKALELSQKIDYKKGLANTYLYLGFFAEDKGNYAEALKNYTSSLKIHQTIGDKKGEADSYMSIGNAYQYQGNYPNSLISYFASLKINESIGDKKGIAASYNNIGTVFHKQGNEEEALKNYYASLKTKREISDKKGIATALSNISHVYYEQGYFMEALKNNRASLKINEAINNKAGIATSYSDIGNIYCQQSNFQQALKNYLASLKIREVIGNTAGIANSYANIGYVYIKQRKYSKAEIYLIKAQELSKKFMFKEILKDVYLFLTELDSTQGNFKGAYENQKRYILYRDSIDNEETRKKTVQTQMTYDFEKKEAATQAEQDKKDAVAAEERTRQRLLLLFIIAIALVVAAIAVIIFRSLRITKKQKQIIEVQKEQVEVQNEEITKQKHIVVEKNHEISSSISYAKRIQRSFLTSPSVIKRHLPDHFILFKPRDIVSGDFYWMHQVGDYSYFCVADCTGHGIPGAFMSLIGMGVLNEIVYSKNIVDTKDILNELRRIVILAVNPEDAVEEGKDGMDLVYLRFHLPTKQLQYSAANNSFYVCRKGELLEFKPDKMPVGSFGEYEKPFTQHTVQLEEGDIIYAITDGYADQFGGPKGKKFKYKQLEEQLIAHRDQTMEDQKKNLEHSFDKWRGDLEQVDDVTVVGIRI